MCVVVGLGFGVTLCASWVPVSGYVKGPAPLSPFVGRRLCLRRIQRRLSDCRAQDSENAEPIPGMTRPPLRYGPQKDSDVEFRALQRRVRVLESLVADLCGALLYSDDMSMLERNTAGMGQIYRDSSFSEAREPVFARNRIRQVLEIHGFMASSQPHRWILLPSNTTASTNATASNETNTTHVFSYSP